MRAIHATLDPRTLNKLIDALTRRLGMPPGELDLPFGISLPELHDEKLGAVLVQLSRIKLRGLDQAFNLSLVGRVRWVVSCPDRLLVYTDDGVLLSLEHKPWDEM